MAQEEIDSWIHNGRSLEDRMENGYAYQTTYGEYDIEDDDFAFLDEDGNSAVDLATRYND